MFTGFARRLGSVVAVSGLVLSLSACGVHWDYGHPVLPEITAQQAAEQRLVRVEQRLAELLPQVSDCADCKPLFDQYLAGSARRQAALGGVWEPWPGGAPLGAEQPVFEIPQFSPAASELARQLVDASLADLAGVDTEADGEHRQLVVSVAVARLHLGVRLAQKTGSWPGMLQGLAGLESFRSDIDFLPEGANELSAAARDWDCAVQVLPLFASSLSADGLEVLNPQLRNLVRQLETTSLAASAQKLSDHRLGSCVGAVEAGLTGAGGKQAGSDNAILRAYDQVLFSTALAASKYPHSGISPFVGSPDTSFALGALFVLLEATELPLAAPLPGLAG